MRNSGVLTPTSLNKNLHSPLSPLTPGSPLYPDGIFTHIWLRKHFSLTPCTFISFHEIYVTNVPNTTSTPTIEEDAADNVLINSLKEMKKVFVSDPRKIKFAVVLLAPKSAEGRALEERFSNIRRSTQLDTKSSIFFLQYDPFNIKLDLFIRNLQLAFVPSTIEYYTELSRKARKKRHRSTVPPPTVAPTNSTQTLSHTGWTVRYEIKLAIFAEFRGEVDVAIRNYETAYEGLMEIFETTNSWSSRWQDARLIADVVAARMIRCFVYLEMSNAAARRWELHKRRMGEMLDRRALGRATYGFAAWEARWAEIMAIIVGKSGIFHVDVRAGDMSGAHPYIPLDKSVKVVEDKFGLNDILLHEGFYWSLAATSAKARRRRALRQTESDANADTYLCPGPEDEKKTDHISIVVRLLENAASEFERRQQWRMEGKIAMEIAELEMERKDWRTALRMLKAGIQGWRREGWTEIVLSRALWMMRECALRGGDAASAIMAELELVSSSLPRKQKGIYDFTKILQNIEGGIQGNTSLVVRASDVVPFVSATFTFKSPEVCVGEAAISQVALTMHVHHDAIPISFTFIEIHFDGNMKSVYIKHDPSPDGLLFDLKGKLQDQPSDPHKPSSKGTITGVANLTFKPEQTKVFEISSILREVGNARAESVTLGIQGEGFEVDYMLLVSDVEEDENIKAIGGAGNALWWAPAANGLRKIGIRCANSSILKILPKPPKMNLSIEKLYDPIFLDEPVRIKVIIRNEEDDEAVARLKVRILGYPNEVPLTKWYDEETKDSIECNANTPYDIGSLQPSQEITRSFVFPAPSSDADLSLEISSFYHLISDKDTPISKTVIIPNIQVRKAFKTKFDFSPSVHSIRWPNYFTLDDNELETADDGNAKGLVQKWGLKCELSLLDEGSVYVEGLSCVLMSMQGGIACTVEEKDDAIGYHRELAYGETLDPTFVLDVTKMSLEDRRSSTLDIELRIRWRRLNEEIVETSLAVPRLLIPGSEPRVLAESHPSSTIAGLINLIYTIENPTMHVLTFNVTMEANELYAFGGSKQFAIQLMPLSRYVMKYRIMPLQREVWIRPVLKVVDKYYNKSLKIAACEGVVGEKGGGVTIWVP